MTLKRFFPLIALSLLIIVIVPSLVFGAILPTIVPCDGTNINGGKECTVCDIATVAQNVLNTGIYVAVFLSAILFAWAGWLYLTNVANPGQIDRAKTIFGNVLIGLLIILAAWIVIDTLMRTLVNPDAQLGPWNEICKR